MEISAEHDDSINEKILAVSEDLLEGFHEFPFDYISKESGVDIQTVLTRIKLMLKEGVIRRVRQTLMATKLAHGALCAWSINEDKIDKAFDFMFVNDPFSGHVVTRSTDRKVSGSEYKLWTTLKVPQGESLYDHASLLKRLTNANDFILMPAKGIFSLGVGHSRRKNMSPGSKSDNPAKMNTTKIINLSNKEKKVLFSIKEELSLDEINRDLWLNRAKKIGFTLEEYIEVAKSLTKKGVIGRFSTFLEHVKPSQAGKRVTKFNALFHWKVPDGMQEVAGGEVGRHDIMTHCYWREGGSKFADVNIMGVVHGTEKSKVLEHKKAIDDHLNKSGISVDYTNVFWGGRSKIKPSEISPIIYEKFHNKWKNYSNVI